jgi:hypothetical protein
VEATAAQPVIPDVFTVLMGAQKSYTHLPKERYILSNVQTNTYCCLSHGQKTMLESAGSNPTGNASIPTQGHSNWYLMIHLAAACKYAKQFWF